MGSEPQPPTPTQAAVLVARVPPREICAVLGPHMTDRRRQRIEEVLNRRLSRLTVVVENLYDPHNGAAALRSAEAVGLQDFHAICEHEPFSIAGGITIHCEQWIDLHEHLHVSDCYEHLRRAGFVLWAASPAGAVPLSQVPVERPVALIFGNERDGLTDAALRGADGTFCLQMHGFTGSFNLSVSVALSVYQTAARVRAQLGRPGDLPPERLERLRALWYCLSVRAAGWILEEAGWRP